MKKAHWIIGLVAIAIFFWWVAIEIFHIGYSPAPCFWDFAVNTDQKILSAGDAARVLNNLSGYVDSNSLNSSLKPAFQSRLKILGQVQAKDVNYLPFRSIRHQPNAGVTRIPSDNEYLYIYPGILALAIDSNGNVYIESFCP